MGRMSVEAMKKYLSSSISSSKSNKLNGLKAEVDFRDYLNKLGFGDRISVGGWISRSVAPGPFAEHTIVMFPETISPRKNYSQKRKLSDPKHGLHTICATFHQLGLKSYFCTPVIYRDDDPSSIQWKAVQLGLPTQQSYKNFPSNIGGFSRRPRRYNFLRYNNTNIGTIPRKAIPEEFAKEHLRVTFQNAYMQETSDIDGIFWGECYTYPIEIKEKTPAKDNKMGEYFGLDLGPFVKLAYYTAKRGNLNSLFVVREIDNKEDRNLVNWLYITYEQLAQYASWVPAGGGSSMSGGRSAVVKIPKDRFKVLDAVALQSL